MRFVLDNSVVMRWLLIVKAQAKGLLSEALQLATLDADLHNAMLQTGGAVV